MRVKKNSEQNHWWFALRLVLACAAGLLLHRLTVLAEWQGSFKTYDPANDPAVGVNVTSFHPENDTLEDWIAAVHSVKDGGFSEVAICVTAFFDPETGRFTDESDTKYLSIIEEAITTAKRLSLVTTVVPMIQITGYRQWRGLYDPEVDSTEPESFWTGLRRFVLSVAEISEAGNADRVALGSELGAIMSNRNHAERIRSLITAAGSVFSGKIGYNCNFDELMHPQLIETVWNAPRISYIGLSAYYSLSNVEESDASRAYPDRPLIERLTARWNDLLDNEILPFVRARKSGDGIELVISEYGLNPFNRSLASPHSLDNLDTQVPDPDEQLNGFHALLASLSGRKKEISAIHFWHWTGGMPGAEGSPFGLFPNAQENRGSRFDPNLGTLGARFLMDFVDGKIVK